MSDAPDITVRDAPDAERYEIRVDGELAGFTTYRLRPGLVAFVHTEIDGAFEGRGLGGRLVAAALDDVRARGLGVLPFCPFVESYIQGHRDYATLVPEQLRPNFGL